MATLVFVMTVACAIGGPPHDCQANAIQAPDMAGCRYMLETYRPGYRGIIASECREMVVSMPQQASAPVARAPSLGGLLGALSR